MDGERARDRRSLRVKGHVEPRVLAEVIEHIRKILRLAGDEAVAHAGREHQVGERRDHLLAADLHGHALALGQADVVAPFLMEGGHELVLGLALDIQAEDVAGLDGLKILAALLAPEAERAHHFRERRVGGGDVGVDLDDVGLLLLGEGLRTLEQLCKGLPVA